MSDTYLALHNLESSLTEFAVARIVDSVLQSSPECQLPADNAVTLDLPNLAVALPDLACDYNIDLPLVPLPHTCSPNFSSAVTLEGCDGTTVDGSLSFTTTDHCNFSLGGLISVCTTVPCSSGYTTTGTITPVTNGTADYVQLYGSISLNNDGACGFSLSGDLTLTDNTPDLSHVCTTQDYKVQLDTEQRGLLIPIIEDFKITIYPKIDIENVSESKCGVLYKLTIGEWTAPVIENLEYKEIKYCKSDGTEETRKFLCLTDTVP